MVKRELASVTEIFLKNTALNSGKTKDLTVWREIVMGERYLTILYMALAGHDGSSETGVGDWENHGGNNLLRTCFEPRVAESIACLMAWEWNPEKSCLTAVWTSKYLGCKRQKYLLKFFVLMSCGNWVISPCPSYWVVSITNQKQF